MIILTQLPPTSKEYFEHYHIRAYSELVGVGDLDKIIGELRLAYRKYPESHKKIISMVNILKSGLNAKLPKEVSRLTPSDIKETLL